MLEIFLFAVFSYCSLKLANKRIDKSDIILFKLVSVHRIDLGFLWLLLCLVLNQ